MASVPPPSAVAGSAPEPLAAHSRLVSCDPDEIRESVSAVFCPHQLKLDRIRAVLEHHPHPYELSITSLAHHYGFIHLGRFAAYYKSRFGEPPSHTLKRRLTTH